MYTKRLHFDSKGFSKACNSKFGGAINTKGWVISCESTDRCYIENMSRLLASHLGSDMPNGIKGSKDIHFEVAACFPVTELL
ncbi:hypothetical protein D3C72_1200590 [compost metagenome]